MKYIPFFAALILLFSCTENKSKVVYENINTEQTTASKAPKPKNIILMIGDGMGISQISAGMIANGNKLNLERFKKIGFHKNQSHDELITDSAAGATAISCGKKTYNQAVGVNPDTIAIESILETAHKAGLATGLVANATITHATPAAFFAHQDWRKKHRENAIDLVDGDAVDMFIGGGKKWFVTEDSSRNMFQELLDKGYVYAAHLEEAEKVEANRFFSFTADDEPLALKDGREPYLTKASQILVSKLAKDEDGFFLMVEGSQIDWGGHDNDAEYIVTEMLEFDEAVGAVLDFAEKDGNTLVIVTADHETGGFAVNGGKKDGSEMKYAFTSDVHTYELIPVFAYGPGDDDYMGIYDNTDIYNKMMAALGLIKDNK